MITIFPAQLDGLDRTLLWPLWIARARGGPVTVIVPSPRAEGSPIDIGLGEGGPSVPGSAGVVTAVRDALDLAWGADSWCPAPRDTKPAESSDESTDGGPDADAPTPVDLLLVPAKEPVPHVLAVGNARHNELTIVSASRKDGEESAQAQQRRLLMSRTTCEIVLLRSGKSAPEGHGVMVAAARGPHAQAALQLAADLGERDHGPVTALYVEPQVGAMAERVGASILAGLVQRGLRERAKSIAQRVVIDDEPHHGILEEAKRSGPELILLGSSKRNAIGQRLRGTVGTKVERSADDVTLAVVRAAVPLRARTLRAVGRGLQRRVPQMSREARVDLVERVQSNSHWDFDFSALMCLATLIAAVGLMQNSAAVVIGAMLVAPLMTPMLGMGLAMAHGNPYLVRATGRSILLGFLTSFLLAFGLGIADPSFFEATPEMLQRNWPELLDLVVAFISGVAAAYASSRPNLMAALPGVAIAAALVPPIATAGLAMSVGNVDLSLGASLLFAVNMVAIVFAAWVTLWAVGLRGERGSRSTRLVGGALIATVLALGIQLSFAPPEYRPDMPISFDAVDRIEEIIGERWRLIEIALDQNESPPELLVRLDGPDDPPAAMAEEIRAAVQPLLDEEVDVRLRHHWAVSARAAGR